MGNIYVSTIDIIPHTGMAQVVEILNHVRQEYYQFYIVNIMDGDALSTKGARESATIILSMLNQNDSRIIAE